MMSQTTNPKRGDIWNKPKASTYSRFGAALFIDQHGHVQHSGLHEYMSAEQVQEWIVAFIAGVPASHERLALAWLASKNAYAASMAEGNDWNSDTAKRAGVLAFARAMKGKDSNDAA
jgi:hypothetical protein